MPMQVAFLVISGWLLLAVTGAANAVPLSTLFAGQSIALGNKVFDQWSLLSYESSDPSRVFDAANIQVTAFDAGAEESGLNFLVSQGDLRVRGDGAGALVNLTFGYRLSALDPDYKIKDSSLWLTLASFSYVNDRSTDNGIRVQGKVGTALTADDLGIMLAEFSRRDSAWVADLSDVAAFAPQSGMWITNTVSIWARDERDSATLAGFSQRFTATAVPEPGTILLVGVALAGLLLGRRSD